MQNLSTFAALLAASLLAQAPNQAVGATRPVLIISYPTVNLSVPGATITLSGKTSDKVAVTNVFYQLNGAGWEPAATTNDWANWTAPVTLTKLGANSVQAYAVDAGTNYSLTNTVKFTYAPAAPLAVQIVGLGTVTPDYNGKSLQISNRYSMTAKAGKGFAFLKWSGSLSTTNPTLSFVMQSNLTLTATFVDVTPPVAIILSPKVHQSVSSAEFTVTGKASDNAGVTNVFYQLNGAGWTAAETTNGWTNWTAQVTLTPGANVVQAFAEDAAGLRSKTNSVSFVYASSAPGDLAPTSLSGLSAVVSSTNDTASFTVSFGAGTFSETMLPGTNQDDNVVGNYAYTKLSADTASLTIMSTAPPNKADHTNSVALTFTSSQKAVFTSTNSNGNVGAGAVVLATAPDLAPASSVAGETADLVDYAGDVSTTVFTSNGGFTNTLSASGIVSAGTYTYTRYSPVGGLLKIDFISPETVAGDTAYDIITFSAAKAGSWFQAFVPQDGGTEEIDYGTFTIAQ
jgi:hypothetical protein